MLKVLITTVAMSLMMLAFTGCGAQPGKTMVTYARGKTPPPLANAAEAGEYSLVSANSPNPIYTVALEANDEYGFTRADDGKVYGVAKGKTIPLESLVSTAYYWKFQAMKNHASDEMK